MAGKWLSSGKKLTGSIVALGLVATGIILGAGPAAADDPVTFDSTGLPVAAEELDAAQLELIRETQSPEEIEAIISMASPDQWVQTYSDSETFETLGAVLLETPPSAGDV